MTEGVECAKAAGTEAGPWRRAGEGRARKQSRKAAEMASQPDESPPSPVPSPPTAAAAASLNALASQTPRRTGPSSTICSSRSYQPRTSLLPRSSGPQCQRSQEIRPSDSRSHRYRLLPLLLPLPLLLSRLLLLLLPPFPP
jgi:hypothetical protein